MMSMKRKIEYGGNIGVIKLSVRCVLESSGFSVCILTIVVRENSIIDLECEGNQFRKMNDFYDWYERRLEKTKRFFAICFPIFDSRFM